MDNQIIDLRLFLTLVSDIDTSQCEWTDVPDLLISLPNKIIGVEHTRLYREDRDLPSGRQPRPQEIYHQQIVKLAQSYFRVQSDILLYLLVDFKDPSNYRRQNMDSEAQALAQSVYSTITTSAATLLSENYWSMHAWSAQKSGIPFPAGVNSYSYSIVAKPSYELWAPWYGYMVPMLDIPKIEQVIQQKESKIESYLARCNEIWLLIATDIGMPSSHYSLPDNFNTYKVKSSFDRIFSLLAFKKQLIEITS
jgi:hypothetical protein